MRIIKITLIIISSLFVLWTGFRLFIDSLTEGKRFESISHSIEDSKKNGSFVCEYEISDIDTIAIEILLKYHYLETLDSVDVWLEKRHKYVNQNLYFNELVFLNNYHLVIQNPREIKESMDSALSMKIIKGEYPDFGIRKENDFELIYASTTKYTSRKVRFGNSTEIRNKSGADRHNFFQSISTIKFQEPQEDVNIWIYLPFMTFDVNDEIVGKLHLKNIGNKLEDDFIDRRPWWKRINI